MTKINDTIWGIMAVNSDDGDEWGWAMSHAFGLTELQYFRGDQEKIPDGLGYQPSPVMTDVLDEEWPDVEYAEEFSANRFTTDDIDYALRVLARYLDHLKHQGKDY